MPQSKRRVERGEPHWYRDGIERSSDDRDVTLAASGLNGVAILDDADDLSIVQMRLTDVRTLYDDLVPWDPYYDAYTYRALSVAPMVTNGDAVAATFSPAPVTSHTLDFRGSTFAALRAELGLPILAYANASIGVVHEPGDDSDFFVGLAPATFAIGAIRTTRMPLIPACYPDYAGDCDALACPDGCDTTTSGDPLDPGDFTMTFDAPHPFTSPGTEMLSISYSFFVPFRHPSTNALMSLYGGATVFTRFEGTSGSPITLEMGPAREARLDGAPMTLVADEWPVSIARDVGLTPTLSWVAPRLGAPEYYEVDITELESATGTGGVSRTRRLVARVRTYDTTATIPPDVLVPGRIYYATIEAISDGRDLEDLRVSPRNVRHLATTTPTRPFTP